MDLKSKSVMMERAKRNNIKSKQLGRPDLTRIAEG